MTAWLAGLLSSIIRPIIQQELAGLNDYVELQPRSEMQELVTTKLIMVPILDEEGNPVLDENEEPTFQEQEQKVIEQVEVQLGLELSESIQ